MNALNRTWLLIVLLLVADTLAIAPAAMAQAGDLPEPGEVPDLDDIPDNPAEIVPDDPIPEDLIPEDAIPRTPPAWLTLYREDFRNSTWAAGTVEGNGAAGAFRVVRTGLVHDGHAACFTATENCLDRYPHDAQQTLQAPSIDLRGLPVAQTPPPIEQAFALALTQDPTEALYRIVQANCGYKVPSSTAFDVSVGACQTATASEVGLGEVHVPEEASTVRFVIRHAWRFSAVDDGVARDGGRIEYRLADGDWQPLQESAAWSPIEAVPGACRIPASAVGDQHASVTDNGFETVLWPPDFSIFGANPESLADQVGTACHPTLQRGPAVPDENPGTRGYTGVVDGLGRGFVGTSDVDGDQQPDLVETTFDASRFAGSTVEFRLRVATPPINTTKAGGWLVDDVRVEYLAAPLDLGVRLDTLFDGNSIPEAVFPVEATVINLGRTAAPETTVHFLLRAGDVDCSVPDPGATVLGSRPVPALEPGGTHTASVAWRPAGPGLVTVCAGIGPSPAAGDQAALALNDPVPVNDVAGATITVRNDPRLSVQVTPADGAVRPGASNSVTIRLTNTGNTPTAATTTVEIIPVDLVTGEPDPRRVAAGTGLGTVLVPHTADTNVLGVPEPSRVLTWEFDAPNEARSWVIRATSRYDGRTTVGTGFFLTGAGVLPRVDTPMDDVRGSELVWNLTIDGVGEDEWKRVPTNAFQPGATNVPISEPAAWAATANRDGTDQYGEVFLDERVAKIFEGIERDVADTPGNADETVKGPSGSADTLIDNVLAAGVHHHRDHHVLAYHMDLGELCTQGRIDEEVTAGVPAANRQCPATPSFGPDDELWLEWTHTGNLDWDPATGTGVQARVTAVAIDKVELSEAVADIRNRYLELYNTTGVDRGLLPEAAHLAESFTFEALTSGLSTVDQLFDIGVLDVLCDRIEAGGVDVTGVHRERTCPTVREPVVQPVSIPTETSSEALLYSPHSTYPHHNLDALMRSEAVVISEPFEWREDGINLTRFVYQDDPTSDEPQEAPRRIVILFDLVTTPGSQTPGLDVGAAQAGALLSTPHWLVDEAHVKIRRGGSEAHIATLCGGLNGLERGDDCPVTAIDDGVDTYWRTPAVPDSGDPVRCSWDQADPARKMCFARSWNGWEVARHEDEVPAGGWDFAEGNGFTGERADGALTWTGRAITADPSTWTNWGRLELPTVQLNGYTSPVLSLDVDTGIVNDRDKNDPARQPILVAYDDNGNVVSGTTCPGLQAVQLGGATGRAMVGGGLFVTAETLQPDGTWSEAEIVHPLDGYDRCSSYELTLPEGLRVGQRVTAAGAEATAYSTLQASPEDLLELRHGGAPVLGLPGERTVTFPLDAYSGKTVRLSLNAVSLCVQYVQARDDFRLRDGACTPRPTITLDGAAVRDDTPPFSLGARVVDPRPDERAIGPSTVEQFTIEVTNTGQEPLDRLYGGLLVFDEEGCRIASTTTTWDVVDEATGAPSPLPPGERTNVTGLGWATPGGPLGTLLERRVVMDVTPVHLTSPPEVTTATISPLDTYEALTADGIAVRVSESDDCVQNTRVTAVGTDGWSPRADGAIVTAEEPDEADWGQINITATDGDGRSAGLYLLAPGRERIRVDTNGDGSLDGVEYVPPADALNTQSPVRIRARLLSGEPDAEGRVPVRITVDAPERERWTLYIAQGDRMSTWVGQGDEFITTSSRVLDIRLSGVGTHVIAARSITLGDFHEFPEPPQRDDSGTIVHKARLAYTTVEVPPLPVPGDPNRRDNTVEREGIVQYVRSVELGDLSASAARDVPVITTETPVKLAGTVTNTGNVPIDAYSVRACRPEAGVSDCRSDDTLLGLAADATPIPPGGTAAFRIQVPAFARDLAGANAILVEVEAEQAGDTSTDRGAVPVFVYEEGPVFDAAACAPNPEAPWSVQGTSLRFGDGDQVPADADASVELDCPDVPGPTMTAGGLLVSHVIDLERGFDGARYELVDDDGEPIAVGNTSILSTATGTANPLDPYEGVTGEVRGAQFLDLADNDELRRPLPTPRFLEWTGLTGAGDGGSVQNLMPDVPGVVEGKVFWFPPFTPLTSPSKAQVITAMWLPLGEGDANEAGPDDDVPSLWCRIRDAAVAGESSAELTFWELRRLAPDLAGGAPAGWSPDAALEVQWFRGTDARLDVYELTGEKRDPNTQWQRTTWRLPLDEIRNRLENGYVADDCPLGAAGQGQVRLVVGLRRSGNIEPEEAATGWFVGPLTMRVGGTAYDVYAPSDLEAELAKGVVTETPNPDQPEFRLKNRLEENLYRFDRYYSPLSTTVGTPLRSFPVDVEPADWVDDEGTTLIAEYCRWDAAETCEIRVPGTTDSERKHGYAGVQVVDLVGGTLPFEVAPDASGAGALCETGGAGGATWVFGDAESADSLGNVQKVTLRITPNVPPGQQVQAYPCPQLLTFTASDWSAAREIDLHALQDPLPDGTRSEFIRIEVDDARSHSDFHDVPAMTIAVVVKDDETPGVTLIESDGSTQVAETGTQDTLTVVLDAPPEDPVAIDVASTDTTKATVSPSKLVFSPSNWDAPQTVTVTGVDNAVTDGTTTVEIDLDVDDAASSDEYDGLSIPSVDVDVIDDETPDIRVISTGGITMVREVGGSDSVNVVLDSPPAADVGIDVGFASGDQGLLDVTPLVLNFTPENWDIPQTLSLRAIDNTQKDGTGHTATVTLTVNDEASDDAYDGISTPFTVRILDDEAPTVLVVQPDGGSIVGESGLDDTLVIHVGAPPPSVVESGDSNDVTLTVGTATGDRAAVRGTGVYLADLRGLAGETTLKVDKIDFPAMTPPSGNDPTGLINVRFLATLVPPEAGREHEAPWVALAPLCQDIEMAAALNGEGCRYVEELPPDCRDPRRGTDPTAPTAVRRLTGHTPYGDDPDGNSPIGPTDDLYVIQNDPLSATKDVTEVCFDLSRWAGQVLYVGIDVWVPRAWGGAETHIGFEKLTVAGSVLDVPVGTPTLRALTDGTVDDGTWQVDNLTLLTVRRRADVRAEVIGLDHMRTIQANPKDAPFVLPQEREVPLGIRLENTGTQAASVDATVKVQYFTGNTYTTQKGLDRHWRDIPTNQTTWNGVTLPPSDGTGRSIVELTSPTGSDEPFVVELPRRFEDKALTHVRVVAAVEPRSFVDPVGGQRSGSLGTDAVPENNVEALDAKLLTRSGVEIAALEGRPSPFVPGQPVSIRGTVSNTGTLPGSTVLYLNATDDRGRTLRLKGADALVPMTTLLPLETRDVVWNMPTDWSEGGPIDIVFTARFPLDNVEQRRRIRISPGASGDLPAYIDQQWFPPRMITPPSAWMGGHDGIRTMDAGNFSSSPCQTVTSSSSGGLGIRTNTGGSSASGQLCYLHSHAQGDMFSATGGFPTNKMPIQDDVYLSFWHQYSFGTAAGVVQACVNVGNRCLQGGGNSFFWEDLEPILPDPDSGEIKDVNTIPCASDPTEALANNACPGLRYPTLEQFNSRGDYALVGGASAPDLLDPVKYSRVFAKVPSRVAGVPIQSAPLAVRALVVPASSATTDFLWSIHHVQVTTLDTRIDAKLGPDHTTNHPVAPAQVVEMDSGVVKAFRLRVTNAGGEDAELHLGLAKPVPDGWLFSVDDGRGALLAQGDRGGITPLTVPMGESRDVNVVVGAPPTGGQQVLPVAAVSAHHPGLAAMFRIVVQLDPQPKPDLAIVSSGENTIELSPDPPNAYEPVLVAAPVSNIGTENAPTARVRFVAMWPDGSFEELKDPSGKTISVLVPQGNQRVARASWVPTQSGPVTIRAVVDPDPIWRGQIAAANLPPFLGRATELVECLGGDLCNNVAQRTVTVKAIEAADVQFALSVRSADGAPLGSQVTLGTPLKVTARLTNNGGAPAHGVRATASVNGFIPILDVQLDEPLEPGQTRVLTATWNATIPGELTILGSAFADEALSPEPSIIRPDGTSFLDDNLATVNFKVVGRGITVTAPDEPAAGEPGAAVERTIQVANRGSEPETIDVVPVAGNDTVVATFVGSDPVSQIDVAPGSTQAIRVVTWLPPSAPAGTVRIPVRISAGGVADQDDILIEVAPRPQALVRLLETTVSPGQSTLPIELTNVGNAPAAFTLVGATGVDNVARVSDAIDGAAAALWANENATGWALSGATDGAVQPGATARIDATIVGPANIEPEQVTMTVWTRADGRTVGATTAELVSTRASNVLLRTPEFLKSRPGTESSMAVELLNAGNMPAHVSVRVAGDGGLTTPGLDRAVQLAPGAMTTLDVPLAVAGPGNASITLEDLGSGRVTRATVPATPAESELHVTDVAVRPRVNLQHGDAVRVTATVMNAGDVPLEDAVAILLVDGVAETSQPLPVLAAGATSAVAFEWSAQRDLHTLTILVPADGGDDPADNAVSATVDVGNVEGGVLAATPRPVPSIAPTAMLTALLVMALVAGRRRLR